MAFQFPRSPNDTVRLLMERAVYLKNNFSIKVVLDFCHLDSLNRGNMVSQEEKTIIRSNSNISVKSLALKEISVFIPVI